MSAGPSIPEERLVTAIIMQAYRDLFTPVRDSASPSIVTQSDQDQAISFLTDSHGRFARRRNSLCSLIGWDGDVLAERIRVMMDGENFTHPNSEPSPDSLKRHTDAAERVRARYRYLKDPHNKSKRPASPVGNLVAAE